MESPNTPARTTAAPTAPRRKPAAPRRHFAVRLSSTRRGARLARRLAAQQLAEWGWPYDSTAARGAGLVVAELAANAALHGRAPGRDFRLRLAVDGAAVLRVEVTDTRPERRPPEPGGLAAPPAGAASGHGLLLVEALADRWGVCDIGPITKTVWCELPLPHPAA